MSGSAVLNLSLLSSDLWAAAARWLLFEGFRTNAQVLAFFGSLVVVIIGLVVYSCGGEVSNFSCNAPHKQPRPELLHLAHLMSLFVDLGVHLTGRAV